MRPIQEGDIVRVCYSLPEMGGEDVKVLHVPCDTGDYWYFERNDGTILAQNPMSSTFDCIIKKPEASG